MTKIAIDIETDGLEPVGGQILEVCMHELTDDLEIVRSFSGVLPFCIYSFSDFILDMHTTSGLVGATATICKSDIAEWLKDYKDIVWLGSSVHFDAAWMKVHFPETSTSHRIIDTSSFIELFDIRPSVEVVAHRAAADIEYSINLARKYYEKLSRSS